MPPCPGTGWGQGWTSAIASTQGTGWGGAGGRAMVRHSLFTNYLRNREWLVLSVRSSHHFSDETLLEGLELCHS